MSDKIRENLQELIDRMEYDREHDSLNFYYDIREALISHLSFIEITDLREVELIEYPEIQSFSKTLDRSKIYDLLLYLVLISYFSVKYLDYYLPRVSCPSLRAIVKLCYSPKMIFDLDYREPELDVLADIFNNLDFSARKNLHCYDCGTTARWVFYNCLRANRGRFYLTETEIYDIRMDYYRELPDRFVCLEKLMHTFRTATQPSIVLIGMRFGDDLFGHILVAEILFPESLGGNKSIVRLYQSALNSYLLIDYLAKMRYLEDEEKGIDLDLFEKDMMALLVPEFWDIHEDNLFAKWYAFWPQDEIKNTEPIRINHAVITY